MKKSGLDLPFTIIGRANIANGRILCGLKKGNCVKISYGLELVSLTILKRIRNMITPKQLENAIKLTRKYRFH